MIATGDAAPDFQLPDQDGEAVRLSDLRGRRVVVYFYPKANTPGCRLQACGLRDGMAALGAADAVVLGVSPDPVDEVKRFHDMQGLNFSLLADADHEVCERYGVWVEKQKAERAYMGAQRSTFVIGPDGVVTDVIAKATPGTHADDVLALLAAPAG